MDQVTLDRSRCLVLRELLVSLAETKEQSGTTTVKQRPNSTVARMIWTLISAQIDVSLRFCVNYILPIALSNVYQRSQKNLA